MQRTMRTANGLTVPVGYGGSGNVRLRGETRGGARSGRPAHATPARERRHIPAADVRPGMKVRGPRTLGQYEVLSTTPDKPGFVSLLMLSPSGAVRTWRRRDDFPMEVS